MSSWHPPEILFSLGSLPIHTYGIILAVAIGLSYLWGERRATARGLDSKLVSDVFFWAIIGALIGARLGFVIQELGYFRDHITEIPALWNGGLSFHGGLVGALITGWIHLSRHKALPQFWLLADAAAAPLLLGAALGRLGNWANQELYGYPTDLPWAIGIDAAHRLPGFEQFTTFHPTFAYEALLNLIGLLILLFIVEKNQKTNLISNLQSRIINLFPAGLSFLFALIWYSLARGITEIWRISDRILDPLSLAQVISLGLILVTGLLLWRRYQSIDV